MSQALRLAAVRMLTVTMKVNLVVALAIFNIAASVNVHIFT